MIFQFRLCSNASIRAHLSHTSVQNVASFFVPCRSCFSPKSRLGGGHQSGRRSLEPLMGSTYIGLVLGMHAYLDILDLAMYNEPCGKLVTMVWASLEPLGASSGANFLMGLTALEMRP
jgi:hypothetical protein